MCQISVTSDDFICIVYTLLAGFRIAWTVSLSMPKGKMTIKLNFYQKRLNSVLYRATNKSIFFINKSNYECCFGIYFRWSSAAVLKCPRLVSDCAFLGFDGAAPETEKTFIVGILTRGNERGEKSHIVQCHFQRTPSHCITSDMMALFMLIVAITLKRKILQVEQCLSFQ